jgi:hypothetical protein
MNQPNKPTPPRPAFSPGLLTALSLSMASASLAAPDPRDVAFFESKIRPLLAGHCYPCHAAGADKIKGGLLLDSQEGWMQGGDSGEAILPGQPDA